MSVQDRIFQVVMRVIVINDAFVYICFNVLYCFQGGWRWFSLCCRRRGLRIIVRRGRRGVQAITTELPMHPAQSDWAKAQVVHRQSASPIKMVDSFKVLVFYFEFRQ